MVKNVDEYMNWWIFLKYINQLGWWFKKCILITAGKKTKQKQNCQPKGLCSMQHLVKQSGEDPSVGFQQANPNC